MKNLRRRVARSFMIAAATLFATAPAFAHGDEGGAAVGTLLPQGVTLVSAGYDFVKFEPISDARLTALAARGVEEVHSLQTIAVPTVSLGYGVTHDFSVGLRLPYLDNEEIRETDPAGPGVNARGGVRGIGDVSFSGTYRLIDDEASGFEAAVTLGVKAPTGRTNIAGQNGELFETEHQPGSGSWDGFAAAAISKETGALTLSASAAYGFNGEGARQTTLGDRFSYGVAASYRVWSREGGFDGGMMKLGTKFDGMMHHGGVNHDEPEEAPAHHHDGAFYGTTLDLSLGLNGQWTGTLETAGEINHNTGGNVVYITPGAKLSVNQWAGFVSVGIPVARDLNGIQSNPDWQLSTGVSLQF